MMKMIILDPNLQAIQLKWDCERIPGSYFCFYVPEYKSDKYRLKRKEKNESREEIFYQMKAIFV